MILTEIYYRVVLKTHKFRTLTLDFLDQKNISCDTKQLEYAYASMLSMIFSSSQPKAHVKFSHNLSSGIRLPSSDNKLSQFYLLRNQCAKWTKLICDAPCMVLFQIKPGDNFVHLRGLICLLIGQNLEIFLRILSFQSYALTKPDCCYQIRIFIIYHVD